MSISDYYIFSDIHGETGALRSLFNVMGLEGQGSHYKSPDDSLLISIGDLVDRGPDHAGAIKIAQNTMDETLLGNHEFISVLYALKLANGEYAREHNDRTNKMHKGFIDQVGWDTGAHRAAVEWFKERPVFLELQGGVNLVHACWHQESIDYLKNSGVLGPNNQLGDAGIDAYLNDEKFERALEMLIMGPEFDLRPIGASFVDAHGTRRVFARNMWMSSAEDLADRLDLRGTELTQWQKDFVNASEQGRMFGSDEAMTVSGHYSCEGESKVPKKGARSCCIDFRDQLTAIKVSANDPTFEQKNMYSVPLGNHLKVA